MENCLCLIKKVAIPKFKPIQVNRRNYSSRQQTLTQEKVHIDSVMTTLISLCLACLIAFFFSSAFQEVSKQGGGHQPEAAAVLLAI